MENKLVAVLTPTYNRANRLIKLYDSLTNQTSKNFIWVVVNDGSTDNTDHIIEKMRNEKRIEILYLKKNNGGKHTALNLGIRYIKNELTFIVDSDDYLTNNAIETIEEQWLPYRQRKDLAGICFLKGTSENIGVGMSFPKEEISSYIDMRIRRKISGDKAEVFRTDLLKHKPFPEIKNEKFIGEDYVWCDLGKTYSMVWRNQIIYICEYLEGGLSKSGRSLRIRCPVGGMMNSSMMLTKEFPLFFRLKKAILYNCYYFFGNKVQRLQGKTNKGKLLRILTYPLGWILYVYWKSKYMK